MEAGKADAVGQEIGDKLALRVELFALFLIATTAACSASVDDSGGPIDFVKSIGRLSRAPNVELHLAPLVLDGPDKESTVEILRSLAPLLSDPDYSVRNVDGDKNNVNVIAARGLAPTPVVFELVRSQGRWRIKWAYAMLR